jgi:two-component system nitrogen regulation response regulator NtrX
MTSKILVIDDEADIRDVLADIFADEGYSVLKAAHSEQAFHIIEKEEPDLIVLDIWLENSDLDGIGILKHLKKDKSNHNKIPVLMISGHGNIEMAVRAMKIGAYDFIEKQFKIDHILLTAQRALEQHHLIKENSSLKHKVYRDTDDYNTKSPALNALLKTVQDDSMSEARVLIKGEIGTGKSKLARYIHQISNRSDSPLFTIKGNEVTKETVEEWFIDNRFNDCTILIEQIEMLQKPFQTQLLKFLSEGNAKSIPRFICTSSNALKSAIEKQEFSSALYDRLAILKYVLPNLKNRMEDFSGMIETFSCNICQPMNVVIPTFSSDAVLYLQNQAWPGNITQLKCLVELTALNHALGETPLKPIGAKEISHPFDALPHSPENHLNLIHATNNVHGDNNSQITAWLDLPLRDARENFEILYLSHLLKRFRGNISQMAGHIDMERTALHRKLKSLDIKYNDVPHSKNMERQKA